MFDSSIYTPGEGVYHVGMKTMIRLSSLGLPLLSALPAMAQNATKAPAPKDTVLQPWALIMITFFSVLLIAVPSFLSSKRGHQD